MQRRFRQVDVFTEMPYRGNPVAVVLDGEGLADDELARIANWTNLSETTFVLPPTQQGADYRVRIFTPSRELPFAGHPTLGTCHAWLQAGGRPAGDDVVQECPAGLVRVRRADGRLAFAAPPIVRGGPADDELVASLTAAAGIDPATVVAAEWVDNGPGWIALLLDSVDAVLAASPTTEVGDLGLVALHPPGADVDLEVRAFFPQNGMAVEDPVTGSLNASVAMWLLGSHRLPSPYVARQGTALGRAGRVHVEASKSDGTIWIGGGTVTCIDGTIEA
jgi:PhzF family phenazine biosynthesis protein